jgi:hypothetical protein
VKIAEQLYLLGLESIKSKKSKVVGGLNNYFSLGEKLKKFHSERLLI